MKKKIFKSMVMVSALALLLGSVSLAAAQDTSGGDDTQQNAASPHRGEMRGMGKYSRAGSASTEALSEEQAEKLEAAKNEFQNATRDLRMALQSKVLALRSELAKKEPDAKTAKSLQREISTLYAELAQKRIEHILEMKKIAPYAGMGLKNCDLNGYETGRGRQNT